MARILVTGGAGYIGSHTVRVLVDAGHEVAVYDDLSNGHRDAVDARASLVVASINDQPVLARTFSDFAPEAVLHFAGAIEPSLSVTDPRRFYRTNVVGTLALADAAAESQIPLVFSSTCAVYGDPETLPVREGDDLRPVSVYGDTKRAAEQIISSFGAAYGLRFALLRYFNAAGADPSGANGADHRLPVHLVTAACRVALGKQRSLTIFGDDYDTPDGTCQRDYIHVVDLAIAHQLTVEALLDGGPSEIYNVGTGVPYSVQEVVQAVERAAGVTLPVEIAPRRAGDPAAVWADPSRICGALDWEPTMSSIGEIARTAWQWHQAHPGGFEDSDPRP